MPLPIPDCRIVAFVVVVAAVTAYFHLRSGELKSNILFMFVHLTVTVTGISSQSMFEHP